MRMLRIIIIVIQLRAINEIVQIRVARTTQDQWITVSILPDRLAKMEEWHHHQQQVIPNNTWPTPPVDYTSPEVGILDRVSTNAPKMTTCKLTIGQKPRMECSYQHRKSNISKNQLWRLR